MQFHWLFLFSFCSFVYSHVSIHLSTSIELSDNSYKTLIFNDQPTTREIADLYCRVSGLPPILFDGDGLLPSSDILHPTSAPVILEVEGGILPTELIQPLVRTRKNMGNIDAPTASSVAAALKDLHNLEVTFVSLDGNTHNANAISNWITNQKENVFVIHHDHRVSSYLPRDEYSPPSEADISNYQICLWTGIILFVTLFSAICAVCNMDVSPDSLLYAKFQSSRANKHD